MSALERVLTSSQLQLSKNPLDAAPAAPKLLKKTSTLSASLTSADGTSAPTPGLPLTAHLTPGNRRITLQPVVSHQQNSSMFKRRSSISSLQPDPMASMFSTSDLRQVTVPIGQIQELGPISWMRP